MELHDDDAIDPFTATCGQDGDYISNQFNLAIKNLTDNERKNINFDDLAADIKIMMNEKEINKEYTSNEVLNLFHLLIEKFNMRREFLINELALTSIKKESDKAQLLGFQTQVMNEFLMITRDHIKDY